MTSQMDGQPGNIENKDTGTTCNAICGEPRSFESSQIEADSTREEQVNSCRCTATYWQIANMMSGGVGNSYGVLYTYMHDSLEVTEIQITWIGSLMTGFHGLASLVATMLIDMKGCRFTTLIGGLLAATGFIVGSQTTNIYVLYITLGVLPGAGVCLTFVATLVYTNQQFTKWRPFAVSFSVVGTAIGNLVWPPLTSFLADSFGWQGATLIHGAILQVHCGLDQEKKSVNSSTNNEATSRLQSIRNYFQIFRLGGMIAVCFANLFCGLTLFAFSTFIPYYILSTKPDMTSMDAAFIVSLSGFGSAIGRLVFAGVSMVHIRAPQIMFPLALCVCGVASAMVPVCETMISQFVNGAIYGFGLGYIVSLTGYPELIFYCTGAFYIISTILMLPFVLKQTTVRKQSLTISPTGTSNDGFTADDST